MLERLDQIPWNQLTHAYGRAEDVPDLLRRLGTAPPETTIRWHVRNPRQFTWRNVMRVQVSVADKFERFAARLAQPATLQGLQIARRHVGHGQANRRSQGCPHTIRPLQLVAPRSAVTHGPSSPNTHSPPS